MKYRVTARFRGEYSIEAGCEVFEVIRSGYDAWRSRQQKAAKEQFSLSAKADSENCKEWFRLRLPFEKKEVSVLRCNMSVYSPHIVLLCYQMITIEAVEAESNE